MVVFGTRPEAIKMCPVVIELKKHNEFQTIVAVTGQHREMLRQVLDIFKVEPDYDLEIMKEGQNLFDITNSIVGGMRVIFEQTRPDIVMVHGDTSTSFATALAAFYVGIKVAHVEAGLRTYDILSPYPEEFNRQAVGIISSYHFAPTEMAKNNLLREGKREDTIWVTGNTVIDALKTTVRSDYSHPELEWCKGKRMVLITVHRNENLGDPMRQIFRGVKKVLSEHEDVRIIFPMHLNPKVRKICYEVLGNNDKIHLIEPLDVVDFHNFMNASYLILTDSGGIQEEAPYMGKPVLVLRNTTERPEGVSAGTVKLVGTNEENIYKEFSTLLNDSEEYRSMANANNPYGDGYASKRIVDCILQDVI